MAQKVKHKHKDLAYVSLISSSLALATWSPSTAPCCLAESNYCLARAENQQVHTAGHTLIGLLFFKCVFGLGGFWLAFIFFKDAPENWRTCFACKSFGFSPQHIMVSGSLPAGRLMGTQLGMALKQRLFQKQKSNYFSMITFECIDYTKIGFLRYRKTFLFLTYYSRQFNKNNLPKVLKCLCMPKYITCFSQINYCMEHQLSINTEY